MRGLITLIGCGALPGETGGNGLDLLPYLTACRRKGLDMEGRDSEDDLEKYSPPGTGPADYVHSLAKMLALGAGAGDLFDHIVGPPIERRRREWMQEVGEALARLESEGVITLEELRSDEEFVSVLVQASRVAIRNHREEKLRALRNAVLNTAIGSSPDETDRQIFISLIDRFTVSHLRILRVLHDTNSVIDERGLDLDTDKLREPKEARGATFRFLVRAFPELESRDDLYEPITDELVNRGLLTSSASTATISSSLRPSYTTSLGDRFLSFIEDPPDDLFGELEEIEEG